MADNISKWNKTVSKEEHSNISRRAQKAGQESWKKKKLLRDYLSTLLETKTETGNYATDITVALVNKALEGDVKAYTEIRDCLGEKVENINLDTNNTIKITIEEE